MDCCLSCESSLDAEQYDVLEMAPGLLELLEKRFGHEVNKGALCQHCFQNLLNQDSKPLHRTCSLDINVCFKCKKTLLKKRSMVIPECPERDSIVRSGYGEVPLNARICYACWMTVKRKVQKDASSGKAFEETLQLSQITTPLMIVDDCIVCNTELFGRRSILLQEGPAKNDIAVSIWPKEIPENARACYVCWKRVQQKLQQEKAEEEALMKEMLGCKSREDTVEQSESLIGHV